MEKGLMSHLSAREREVLRGAVRPGISVRGLSQAAAVVFSGLIVVVPLLATKPIRSALPFISVWSVLPWLLLVGFVTAFGIQVRRQRDLIRKLYEIAATLSTKPDRPAALA
jgi:hypothetical protein